MNPQLWKKLILIGIVLILVISITTNYYWLKNDNTPFSGCDSSHHLYNSLLFFYRFSDIVSNPSLTFLQRIKGFYQMMRMNPSNFHKSWALSWSYLTYLVSSIFNLSFGNSLFVTRLSMSFWGIILILSTYFLGKEMFNSSVGLLSAFFVSMYPPIFVYSRLYGLDFPLTSIVALGMLFLIKCKNFSSRKYSVFLGISSGFGILVKMPYLIFFVPPLAIILIDTFREKEKRRERFFNFLIFFILSVLISSIWWENKLPELFRELIYVHNSPRRIGEPFSNILNPFLWYIIAMSHLIGELFFSLFIISLILFTFSKSKHKWFLLIWIFFPYLLFPIIASSNRWIRYLFPILPAMGLVSAWGISKIPHQKYRISILVPVIIFSLLQFISISFKCPETSPIFRKLKENIKLGARTDYLSVNRKIKKLSEILVKNSSNKKNIRVGVILFPKIPDPSQVLYLLKLEDRRIFPLSFHWQRNQFLEEFPSMEFIVLLCFKKNKECNLLSIRELSKYQNKFEFLASLSYREKHEDCKGLWKYIVYRRGNR